MSKNEEEIILHFPQDNSFTEKIFELFNKLNVIGFFSAIIFALGFFIKIGLYYYHATYLSVLGIPELFPIENYYDDPYKVWLLWLLVVIILGYIFLIYLAMYLFLKNLDSFRKTCVFYFIVQLIFVTFALIATQDNTQRIVLIGFLLVGSIFVGLSGYFAKKNTKKSTIFVRLSGYFAKKSAIFVRLSRYFAKKNKLKKGQGKLNS